MKPKADVLVSLWTEREVGGYLRIASTSPETVQERIEMWLRPFLKDGVHVEVSIVPTRFK